jgi:hypothetical protein
MPPMAASTSAWAIGIAAIAARAKIRKATALIRRLP